MNNLRISNSRREIINILKRIQMGEEEVFVWQNKEGKRDIIYCQIEKIDQGIGNFSIRPVDPTQILSIEKSMTLYMKGKLESILFKQDISFTSPSMAVLKIPKEVRLIEKRSVQRVRFDMSDEKKFSIAKYAPNSKKPRRFDLIALDISQKGMSFFIVPSQLLSFSIGDHIYILELEGKKIDNPVEAIIKYISRYSGNAEDVKGHRLGVQFLTPMPQEMIDYMISARS